MKRQLRLDGGIESKKLEVRLGRIAIESDGEKGRHRMRLGGCGLVGERQYTK